MTSPLSLVVRVAAGGIISAKRRFLRHLLISLLTVVLLGSCSPEAKKARHLGRAEEYFKAGEYEKAKIEYMFLLRVEPRSAIAFQRLGLMWLEEGAPFRAAAYLLKAQDLTPNDLETKVTLARALFGLGRLGEARQLALTVLEQSPDQDEALILLADTDRTQADLEATEERLAKAARPDTAAFQMASGNVATQRGDFASAEISIRRAITLDPQSSLPHLAMAKLHLLQGKTEEAGEEFKAAVKLSRPRSNARLAFADFRMRSGAVDEAAEIFRESTKAAPDYLPAWQRLSEIAFNRGKYGECLKLLENILARDAQNLEARIVQAKVWLATGQTQQAIEKLEDLCRTNPKVPQLNYELALAYLKDKNPSQATTVLRQAIAAKPDYVDAILLLGKVDLETGSAALTVRAMVDLLTNHPHLLSAEMLLMEAYLSSGRPSEAAAVVREQIRFYPQSADAYYRLGLILSQQNKSDEARAAFEKVLELAPGNLMAINQLVDLDIKKKDFDSGLARAEAELNRTPPPAVAYFMKGKVYAAEGKFDQAESPLLKALELDPDSLGTYNLLISTYLAANKISQAVHYLEALLSKNPKQTEAWISLALSYEKAGNFDKARDAYEKALSLNPDSAAALNNLAALCAERFNQLDRAYELAEKARSLEPVNAAIADTLGWILYKQHHYQEALRWIREAAEKVPDDPEIQFRLGVTSYMMGRPQEAKVALKKAVGAKAEFPGKDEARRWLAPLDDDINAPQQFSKTELQALLEQRPNDVIARNHLAALLEKEGAIADAALQYEDALNINPGLLDTTLKLAQLYAGPLHNFPRALELAQRARDLDGGDPKTITILGRVAYLTGNFGWAYDLVLASAHGRTKDPTLNYDLALAAYSLGKVDEAQKAMGHALELGLDQERTVEAKRFLALVTNDGRAQLGESEIESLLKSDPDYVPALMVRATFQTKKGEINEAIETYNRVLRRFPDFAPAQKGLAALYVQNPNTEEQAYELATKAHVTLQNDLELSRILGELNYQKNKYEYALQLLQESTRARPLDAAGLYYLGMCQFHMQQNVRSREALQRSLAAGLKEPFASDARRILAEMPKPD